MQLLGAHFPTGEIFLLLVGQLVNRRAHRFEFQRRYMLIKFARKGQHILAELLVVLDDILRGQRLVGKRHIHHHRRVSFCGGQIDQAPFAEHVDFAS